MRFRLFVSAAAVILMGTAAMAQKITYDVDRSANFAGFKTYAWIPGTNLSDPLNHKRVVEAVTHVQYGSHVRRRHDDRERLAIAAGALRVRHVRTKCIGALPSFVDLALHRREIELWRKVRH